MNFKAEIQNHFPHLHLLVLKNFAKDWIESFSDIPIKSIILCHRKNRPNIESLVSKAIEKDGRSPKKIRRAKYELIFVVPYNENLFKDSILGASISSGEEALEFTLDLVNGKKERGTMQNFLDIIQYEGTYFDHDNYEFLMPAGSFENVYKTHTPSKDWRTDWEVSMSLDPDTILKLGESYCDLIDNSNLSLPESESKILEKQKYIWQGSSIDKWEDIKITLIAKDIVRIDTPNDSKKLSYSELNMKDNRTGDRANTVWGTLKTFAVSQGVFPNEGQNYLPDFSDKTKALNKALKKYFQIKESIFKHHYRKYRKWETKFTFSSQCDVQGLFNNDTLGKSLHEQEVGSANKLIPENKRYDSI